MNERIKELSKQAAEFVEENSVNWVPDEFEQKFAELIISECAALAKSKSEHIEGIKTEDHDDQIHLQSLSWQFKEFGYEIKKHFGFEK
jgi:hypothetical protein